MAPSQSLPTLVPVCKPSVLPGQQVQHPAVTLHCHNPELQSNDLPHGSINVSTADKNAEKKKYERTSRKQRRYWPAIPKHHVEFSSACSRHQAAAGVIASHAASSPAALFQAVIDVNHLGWSSFPSATLRFLACAALMRRFHDIFTLFVWPSLVRREPNTVKQPYVTLTFSVITLLLLKVRQTDKIRDISNRLKLKFCCLLCATQRQKKPKKQVLWQLKH